MDNYSNHYQRESTVLMGLGNLNHELFLLGHQHKLTQMLTKDEWNLEGTIEDRKHTEQLQPQAGTTRECSLSH